MSNDKKIYYVSADVTSIHGSQTYKVIASSEEEAIKIANDGGGEFECEELEIQDMDSFYLSSVEELGSDKPAPIYKSEPPTQAGYYWFRFNGLNSEIISVKNLRDGSLVATTGGVGSYLPMELLVKEGGEFGPRINPPAEGE